MKIGSATKEFLIWLAMAASVLALAGTIILTAEGAEQPPAYCEGMARPSDEAPCPPANAKKTERSESLEVATVVATEKGPQFTDAGCFMYGQFYATVAKEREGGMALIAQLSRLSSLAVELKRNGGQLAPGVLQFLADETVTIYNLPVGFLELEWVDLRDSAIKRCREAKGATWIMRERV